MTSEEEEFEWRKLKVQQSFDAAKAEDERNFREAIDARAAWREASKEYARQVQLNRSQYDTHMKDYATLALRSLFIANGGAILATFTLIGSTFGKAGSFQADEFVRPLICFACGVAFAVIAMLSAYLNYSMHKHVQAEPGSLANAIMSPQDTWPHDLNDRSAKLINSSFYVAFLSGLASIVAFVWGCFALGLIFTAARSIWL